MRTARERSRAVRATALAAAAALVLSACGGDEPEPLPEPETQAPAEEEAAPAEATVELPEDVVLPFEHTVVYGDVEFRFTSLVLSELNPEFAEAAQFMSPEELNEVLPMLEASGDLYAPHVTAEVVVVNPLDQQVRIDGDLFRLLQSDGLASAPSSWIGESLDAGTSTELEVQFGLPTTDLTGLVLQLGAMDSVPVLLQLPDGPVTNAEPVELDLELEGEYLVSRDARETTLAVTLLGGELRADLGPDLTHQTRYPYPYSRRADAGTRWLVVELDVVNLGREDRSPTWSGVRVTDDDVRLQVDDRPLGIDQLESPGSMIELDEQQVWTIYVQVPIGAQDVELRIGDRDDPMTVSIDVSGVEALPGELD